MSIYPEKKSETKMKVNIIVASWIIFLFFIPTKAICSQNSDGTQNTSEEHKLKIMQLQYPEELNPARTSRDQKKYDDAIQSYELAIDKFPNTIYTPIAYVGIGDCYKAQGKDVEAREFYRRAILLFEQNIARSNATDPVFIEANKGLVAIYWQMEDWERVTQYLGRLLEPETSVVLGAMNIGICYMDLGRAYEKQENWKAAVSAYTQALEHSTKAGGPLSNISTTHSRLAQCHIKLQNWKAAIKEIQKQIDIGEKYLNDNPDLSESRRKLISHGIQTAQMEIEEISKMQSSYVLPVLVGVGIVIVIGSSLLLLTKKASSRTK